MLPKKIAAACIGVTARDLLAQNREAKIVGVISRGVFLRFPSGWVIFNSYETMKGPLTLNCPMYPGAGLSVQPGEAVEVTGDTIYFPQAEMLVDWNGARTWQAPELPSGWLSDTERKARLVKLAGVVHVDSPSAGLSYLLPGLLDLPDIALPTGVPERLPIMLRTIQQNLSEPSTGYEMRVVEALAPFIGLGGGLTPSGDDLNLGFLLVLNRWGQRLHPRVEVSKLNQVILERTDNKTTSISASLIRCAAAGQADERLILALDGLLTGAEDIPAIERTLRSWGNSSGIDALVGMATVISACTT